MNRNIIYCHFYHVNGYCFKGSSCGYQHGKRITPCPNNDKCPIKSCAEEYKLKNKSFTLTKPNFKKDLLPTKKANVIDILKEPTIKKSENFPVLGSEKQVIFQSKLSAWDDVSSFIPSHTSVKMDIQIDDKEKKNDESKNMKITRDIKLNEEERKESYYESKVIKVNEDIKITRDIKETNVKKVLLGSEKQVTFQCKLSDWNEVSSLISSHAFVKKDIQIDDKEKKKKNDESKNMKISRGIKLAEEERKESYYESKVFKATRDIKATRDMKETKDMKVVRDIKVTRVMKVASDIEVDKEERKEHYCESKNKEATKAERVFQIESIKQNKIEDQSDGFHLVLDKKQKEIMRKKSKLNHHNVPHFNRHKETSTLSHEEKEIYEKKIKDILEKLSEIKDSDKKQSEDNKEITKKLNISEEEELTEVYVKSTHKPVEIKQGLPDLIKNFIETYYPENEEAANFISNFYQIQEDMNLFLPVYENIPQSKQQLELDLMFIVDCTGSMESWINAVKQEISGIIKTIKNQNTGCIIRVSFVGYRDYGDSERYSIFDFSNDVESFQKFILGVEAKGGNDEAEDVAGGFKHANLQNWKSQAKYAVLLADAAAHGSTYNRTVGDRFPDGDPDGVDLKYEFKTLISKGVKLFAVEITPETNTMFNLFKTYNKEINGQNLDITKLGNSTQQFGSFISQTASKTLTMSYTRESKFDPQSNFYKALMICQGQNTVQSSDFQKRLNLKNNKEQNMDMMVNKKDIKEILYQISPQNEFPDFSRQSELKSICHTYFIVQEEGIPINWRKPLVQNSSIKTSIKIRKTPFAEGTMRYAFYSIDTLLRQKLVAKINKKQNKDNALLDKEEMIKDLESQFLSQHIVNQFNDRISEHVQSTENLKSFVHCYIYEILDSSHPHKYYTAENYLSGDYEKFNNNAGWCNLRYDESGLLQQALSHFSYQLTEGYLMLVDLQGAGGLLTDPQIHCLDQHRFGAGNLGYLGMFQFFLSHSCNQYCQHLNLIHPSIKELPQSMNFFTNQLVKPLNPYKQVCCMCDICKSPFQINAGFLFEKRKQCREKYCPPCNKKRLATMVQVDCIFCKETFSYSTYWTQMKRTDSNELCRPCRRLLREKLRSEIE